MTSSTNRFETAALEVLDNHLPEETTAQKRLLASTFGTVLTADSENRIGRSHQDQIKLAISQLERVKQSLETSIEEFSALGDLSREMLSSAMTGTLDGENTGIGSFFYADVRLGYEHKVLSTLQDLKSIHEHVIQTLAFLKPISKTSGRGRPRKDGALTVAQLCASVFEGNNKIPSSPSWNPYNSETFGRFYSFVNDMFEAGAIKANPEEYAKQAIEKMKQNK